MKITIDTTAKTLKLNAPIDVHELIEFINQFKLNDYILLSTGNSEVTPNPYVYPYTYLGTVVSATGPGTFVSATDMAK